MWWQVFELWEGLASADGSSEHYVRVLFNKEELALAKHPKGYQCCACPARAVFHSIAPLQGLLLLWTSAWRF